MARARFLRNATRATAIDRSLRTRAAQAPGLSGGRSEMGTLTANCGRSSVDDALAQASTRIPDGKAISILPGPGATVTTPVPNVGCVTRSPAVNDSFAE